MEWSCDGGVELCWWSRVESSCAGEVVLSRVESSCDGEVVLSRVVMVEWSGVE